jgi:hypothetical protein
MEVGCFWTTPDIEHATRYATHHNGQVYGFRIPKSRLNEMVDRNLVSEGVDNLKGTTGYAPSFGFRQGPAAEEMNLWMIK